ncbi:nuclear pore complex protein Nup54-like isoform X2 [Daphnia carinata]|uniref:nuclear pore complex protein Nup54-like isoform X2 n=1 Tax=Daphnia carinata TaxID=120202 RepID=UPI00286871B2|nr:nuclear pore complex protein Nup54-like isoform X2 [Daphnia carinata]
MSFSSGSLFQPAQSSTSTTGLFGGTGQTGTTSFGGFGGQQVNTANQPFSFGTQQVNATPALGFGTQQTNTTAAAPTFGFGTTQATSATPGFGFGATQTSTAPSFGFSGTQTSSAAPTFGFGGTQTNLGAPTFGFGQPQTSNTGFGFGLGTSTASTSTGLFSGTGGGSFGASLGSTGTAPSGTSFSLGTPAFGSTAPSTGLFGQQTQPQPTPPAQQAGTQVESVLSSVLYCNVYGDERDAILARWNLLQAAWGTGKGFYSGTASAVQYTAENSLCRFKAIGYSKLPQGKNEDGIIVLLFNKPEADIRRDQAQLVSVITTALGNKPNLNVTVEGVSGLDINKTEVLICVQERSATGAIHKVPAIELSSFLWSQQPSGMMQTARGQLSTLGVVSCVPRVRPTPEQLREYLASPPAGIDARIWKQAQSENPDRDNFIPIPLIGFGDLVRHLHLQEKETRRHQGTLDKLAEELANLQSRASETSVALSEQRRRYIDLQHRILKVLIKQECSRKEGFALQPEEERLRVQLESVHNELSIPTQFRGRLNELLSQIRMRQSAFMPAERMAERYNIEPNVLDDLKQVLKSQQEGMAQLMNILKEDFNDLLVLDNALKH